MGNNTDLKINGRIVSPKEFEELHRVFLQTGNPAPDIFDDGNVTEEKIIEFLDFDKDGRFTAYDFRLLPYGTKIYQHLKMVLRQHNFNIEDHCLPVGVDERSPEFILKDREFILAAIKKEHSVFAGLPERMRNNREFVLAAAKENGLILQCLSDEFREDREIVLAAIGQNKDAAEYAGRGLISKNAKVAAAVAVNKKETWFEGVLNGFKSMQKRWKIEIKDCHKRGIFFPPDMEKDRASFDKVLKERYNIDFPGRMSFKAIHTIMKNREPDPFNRYIIQYEWDTCRG